MLYGRPQTKKNSKSKFSFETEVKPLKTSVSNNDFTMSDMVLAFNLLDTSDLSDMERKLVLTGVNYTEGKSNKTLLSQMKEALKKFIGKGFK